MCRNAVEKHGRFARQRHPRIGGAAGDLARQTVGLDFEVQRPERRKSGVATSAVED